MSKKCPNKAIVPKGISCYNTRVGYPKEARLYKVAGIVFEAKDCGNAFTARAEKYRVGEGVPEFVLTVTEEEVERCGIEASEDGKRYMVSGSKFYVELIKRGGMMLHSSAVAVGGKAYLFSADPGVGKSTHTGYWLELFPEAFILNDDKPALLPEAGGVTAYGTPWSGKHDISVNAGVPVGGIAFIERAETNFIEPMPSGEAVFRLLSQTLRHVKRERMEALLGTLDRVIRSVPIYRLGATNDISAAELACRAMIKV